MAYIEIELDDIDFDDLVREVTDRLKSDKDLSDYEERLVRDLAKEIGKALNHNILTEGISLADQMKLEYVHELMDRYSENQLREMAEMYQNSKQKTPVL